MIYRVRYSVWIALGWIALYLIAWILGFFVVLAVIAGVLGNLVPSLAPVLRDPPAWAMVIFGVIGALGSLWHAGRYWQRLLDRSVQIEVHPTFLRARQLDHDILWREVVQIGGEQRGIGSDEGSNRLYLDLADGRRIVLDLVGMTMGMQRLYRLAGEARDADQVRRSNGQSLEDTSETKPPRPTRTHGHTPAELGEEVARFGASGYTGLIVFGLAAPLALFVLGMIFDLLQGSPTPSGGALVIAFVGSLLGVPMLLIGLSIMPVRLILYRNGLAYRGQLRSFTVLYGDIRHINETSIRATGESDFLLTSVDLILRDGRTVRLQHLRDLAAVSRQVNVLRQAIS